MRVLVLAQLALAKFLVPVLTASEDKWIESKNAACNSQAETCLNSEGFSNKRAGDYVTTGMSQPPLPKTPKASVLSKLYGVEQSLDDYDHELLFRVNEYFQNVVMKDEKLSTVREICKNEDEQCTYWASVGECDNNPGFMHLSCAPACLACHKLIFEERCPFDLSLATPDALQPGDLNKLFERIATDPNYLKEYNPTVVCKPGMENPSCGTDDCPWIVVIDDFLTEHESETLIELGSLLGYKRSRDVGERKPDGTYSAVKSEGRTSTNAWCEDVCHNNATVQEVLARLENLTGIPDDNAEALQLLRYEVGQFYESHHDYIPHDINRAQGPRILTAFLYLNDVESGGETHFTSLNISVHPKRGRVVLWPSVDDSNPNNMDSRTSHQAKPVLAGIKYGANSWIHLRNFKKPHEIGCT